MAVIVNVAAVIANGINGRGKKRDGATTSPGGRTATSGQDVTNQVTSSTDTK